MEMKYRYGVSFNCIVASNNREYQSISTFEGGHESIYAVSDSIDILWKGLQSEMGYDGSDQFDIVMGHPFIRDSYNVNDLGERVVAVIVMKSSRVVIGVVFENPKLPKYFK